MQRQPLLMTHRAFILARPYDIAIARACSAALTARGWLPSILLDPREWDEFPTDAIASNYWTEGRGMFGNECAARIAFSIWTHSERGDVVAKFDCDTRLTDAASQWLAGASESARCLTLAGRYCGTLWAAPRAQVAAAADLVRSMAPCRCPESGLLTKAFRYTGGLDHHPTLTLEKWMPPRPWPETAGAITLPAVCRGMSRRDAGLSMFDAQPVT
jgi:hypothetical protein